MKTTINLEQIYFNMSLKNFFFRDQSYNTLEELVNRSTLSGEDTLSHLDEYYQGSDLDDVEEMFYSESVEYIANDCGLDIE